MRDEKRRRALVYMRLVSMVTERKETSEATQGPTSFTERDLETECVSGGVQAISLIMWCGLSPSLDLWLTAPGSPTMSKRMPRDRLLVFKTCGRIVPGTEHVSEVGSDSVKKTYPVRLFAVGSL